MCGMCPDYVDTCYMCPPVYIKDNGQPKYRQFYLDLYDRDPFCEHLTEEHGTSNTSLYMHIQWEHDMESDDPYTCDDDCVKKGWYEEKEIHSAIRAYNSNSE